MLQDDAVIAADKPFSFRPWKNSVALVNWLRREGFCVNEVLNRPSKAEYFHEYCVA